MATYATAPLQLSIIDGSSDLTHRKGHYWGDICRIAHYKVYHHHHDAAGKQKSWSDFHVITRWVRSLRIVQKSVIRHCNLFEANSFMLYFKISQWKCGCLPRKITTLQGRGWPGGVRTHQHAWPEWLWDFHKSDEKRVRLLLISRLLWFRAWVAVKNNVSLNFRQKFLVTPYDVRLCATSLSVRIKWAYVSYRKAVCVLSTFKVSHFFVKCDTILRAAGVKLLSTSLIIFWSEAICSMLLMLLTCCHGNVQHTMHRVRCANASFMCKYVFICLYRIKGKWKFRHRLAVCD